MKAIQLLAPLALVLTIACDEQTSSTTHTDDQTAENARSERDSGFARISLKSRGGDAAHTMKMKNLISALADENMLSPFATRADRPLIFGNCAIVHNPNPTYLQSSCNNLPDHGYLIQISECHMGNGDSFSGRVFVSHPIFEDVDILSMEEINEVLLDNNNDSYNWEFGTSLTTGEGKRLEACGSIDGDRNSQDNEFEILVTQPDAAPFNFAIEESMIRSEATNIYHGALQALAGVESERIVQATYVTHQKDGLELVPARGQVNFETAVGSESIRYRRQLSTENRVLSIQGERRKSVATVPNL